MKLHVYVRIETGMIETTVFHSAELANHYVKYMRRLFPTAQIIVTELQSEAA